MSEDVKYKVNGDNSVLRSVLYDLWKGRCYWCNRPKAYGDVDIDHIVPRTIGADRLKELKAELLLSEDFDVHDPLNLALICRTCNGPGDKGSNDFSHVPRVLTRLRHAQKLRDAVVRRVETFTDAGAVASALLRAKAADLSDPNARQALEEHAPALVQALALLGEEKVEYTVFRSVEVDLGNGTGLEVEVSLDSSARRATTILEDVCGGTVEAVLQEPITDLYREIHADTESAFEGMEVPSGQMYSGPPVSTFMSIDVDSIAFQRIGTFFEFKFDGGFEASLSASLMRDDAHGDLEDVQGEAYVTGRFSFTANWEAADDVESDVHPSEPWIEDLEQELWVET